MTTDQKFELFAAFRKEHGDDNFSTLELAKEFITLKRDWWGSNLVVLETRKNEDGTFSPQFNVWN